MKDLFEYDKSAVIKTNEKLDVRKLRRERKQDLKVSTRDDNFRQIMKETNGLPNHDEYLALKTNGTSDCGSIFTYILDEYKVIDEMYLATWTISKANTRRIERAIAENKLKHLTMVFSSTLKPANPALYASLVGALKKYDCVKLKEVNSHAKTFSVKCGNNYFTVSGSANWSENPRIENFLILNDIELYNHHKEWMSELAELV